MKYQRLRSILKCDDNLHLLKQHTTQTYLLNVGRKAMCDQDGLVYSTLNNGAMKY